MRSTRASSASVRCSRAAPRCGRACNSSAGSRSPSPSSAWVLLQAYNSRYPVANAAPDAVRLAARVAFATMQWCAIVAVIGFARRYLNRDHRWRHTLSEAVFPVYILHQTITILLAASLRPLHWAPALEGPVLVAGTFLLSYGGYLLVRRVRLLRPWFGLARQRAAATGRLAVPQQLT